MSRSLAEIMAIYRGSDGDATKRLYEQLEALGAIGTVAINLFRAQKNSERAKKYRGRAPEGGSYRGRAYDRKQWAMDNLCKVLAEHAGALRLPWGWQQDPEQPKHCWVLYVDLPTGQVSFHTEHRGAGPDYSGAWDRFREMSAQRICQFVEQAFRYVAPAEDAA